MAAHDGFGLVDDVPTENKKGARCQPLLVGLGVTFRWKLSCAPVKPCLQITNRT
jgi:hypothetical protein